MRIMKPPTSEGRWERRMNIMMCVKHPTQSLAHDNYLIPALLV